MRKILVTGSSGRIGQAFVAAYQERYEFVLTDLREPPHPVGSPHRFVQSDLSDANAAGALCLGMDAVVHLAGVPDPNAEFDQVKSEMCWIICLDAAPPRWVSRGRFVPRILRSVRL